MSGIMRGDCARAYLRGCLPAFLVADGLYVCEEDNY